MTQQTGARWAPDPTGRHELRFWDGRNWTANVMDDDVPGQDALSPSPSGTAGGRSAPAPLLPWWGHLLVGLVTCGLWFVVAPAVYWFRRGAVKPALIWSAGWAVLIGASALGGGTEQVATVAATSPVTTTTAPTSTLTSTVPTSTVPASSLPTSRLPTSVPPGPRALVAAVTSSPAPARRATAGSKATTTTTARAKRTTTTRARRTTEPVEDEAGTDPRFSSCKKAKAAGYGPYRVGEVEYGWYDDRDHDGIVCE